MGKKKEETHTPAYLDLVLWLPAGKTNFGEVQSTDRFGRKEADQTIATKIHWMFETNADDLNIHEIGEYKTEHNGPLGCRELRIRFAYRGTFFSSEPVHELLILSNGLYRWRLKLPTGGQDAAAGKWLQNLAQTFLLSHVYPFFHSEWSKSALIRNDEDRYRGALTFYQRELLFEGPFNIYLCCHPSFLLQISSRY